MPSGVASPTSSVFQRKHRYVGKKWKDLHPTLIHMQTNQHVYALLEAAWWDTGCSMARVVLIVCIYLGYTSRAWYNTTSQIVDQSWTVPKACRSNIQVRLPIIDNTEFTSGGDRSGQHLFAGIRRLVSFCATPCQPVKLGGTCYFGAICQVFCPFCDGPLEPYCPSEIFNP